MLCNNLCVTCTRLTRNGTDITWVSTYAHMPHFHICTNPYISSNTLITLLARKICYVSTRCMGCAKYVSITWLRKAGRLCKGFWGAGRMGSKSTGSREHGAKKTREQGAKESNLERSGQKIMGIVSKNLTQLLGFSLPRFARLIFCHIFCISTSMAVVNSPLIWPIAVTDIN